ncbi:MAG: hypothetical protein L0Y66_18300, partial [Myxococcaceae bacterium]|nr:hypothetical protein [Myxococcaceae bacterium]
LINGLQVLCQGRVPRRLQGRVSSLLSAALSGGYAVGVASLGWLGDHVGLRVSAAGAALLFTGLLLLAWQATAGALRATRPGTS